MLKKFIKWDRPYALGLGEWSKWEKEKRTLHPIKYFLFETVPSAINSISYFWRHKIKWPLLHRYHHKYKFHIIKTQLEPGYYDPDILMIEAMFVLLHEFVEHMKEHEAVDWYSDEAHEAAWEEMLVLDEWWVLRRTRSEKFEKEHPYPDVDFIDIISHPELKDNEENKTWREVADIHNKQDDLWKKEDDEMMGRLIAVRHYMWYP